MRRPLALAAALLFLAGFASLTAKSIADQGLTGAAVVAILIIALLAVGIIGAILGDPRDPPR